MPEWGRKQYSKAWPSRRPVWGSGRSSRRRWRWPVCDDPVPAELDGGRGSVLEGLPEARRARMLYIGVQPITFSPSPKQCRSAIHEVRSGAGKACRKGVTGRQPCDTRGSEHAHSPSPYFPYPLLLGRVVGVPQLCRRHPGWQFHTWTCPAAKPLPLHSSASDRVRPRPPRRPRILASG